MNGIDRNRQERIFTTGEKALAAMIAAGIFGYWAGFNLAAPGEWTGLPVAASAALPAVVQEARAAPAAAAPDADRPWRDGPTLRAVTERDEPAIPSF